MHIMKTFIFVPSFFNSAMITESLGQSILSTNTHEVFLSTVDKPVYVVPGHKTSKLLSFCNFRRICVTSCLAPILLPCDLAMGIE